MRDPFFARLEKVVAERGPMCVGLDPSRELLDHWGLNDDAGGVERLVRTTLDAVADVVGVVKPQVAFYERHGSAGFAVLERLLGQAREAGLLAVADAKRGDIRSTNEGYAQAWLSDESPLATDAVTVSCYLGAAAHAPAFELARATGRGVFAVVASSNPEGRSLQTAVVAGGEPVESALLAQLAEVNRELDAGSAPVRCVGAVIGATRQPDGLSTFEGPVLVTGVGAQGAAAGDVRRLRDVICHDAVVVNVARHVLDAGPNVARLRDAAARFAEALR